MSAHKIQSTTAAKLSPSPSKAKAFAKVKSTIDAQLDEIIHGVLPITPYILRMPRTSSQSIHHYHLSYYWVRETPLKPGEEELQYMTFRQSPDGMLRSHGQWDDGKGGVAPPERPSSQASSGHTPGQSHTVKRKIGLSEYMNRDKSQSVGKDAAPQQKDYKPESNEQPSDQQPAEKQGKREPEPEPEKMSIEIAPPSADPKDKPSEERVNIKRPLDAIGSSQDTQQPDAKSSPPVKRRRLSEGRDANSHTNEASKAALKPSVEQTKAANLSKDGVKTEDRHIKTPSQPKGTETASKGTGSSKDTHKDKRLTKLPPMLSPTLPTADPLPPLLSPTLPREVEEALFQLRKENGTALSAKTSNLKVASSKDASTPVDTIAAKKGTNELKPGNLPAPRGHTTGVSGAPGKSQLHERGEDRKINEITKTSLIVKLKIKKKQNRKELIQYLKLKPTPNKVHWKRKAVPEDRPTFTSNKQPALPMLKRERTQDDEGLARKRRRGSDASANHAVTPMPGSSPPISRPVSVQKSRLDARPTSTTMQRVGSGRSFAATPQDHSRHGTPSVLDKESPTKHDTLRADYHFESERLMKLGRDLKHDADKYMKADNLSQSVQELGLVVATEAVLCFMLSAAVFNEPYRIANRPGHIDNWRSMLHLLNYHIRNSQSFPHLWALLNQLEGLVRDTIHHHDLLKIRNILREPYSEGQEPPLQRNHALIKDDFDNQTRAAKAWQEGHASLWVPELQETFPNTWKRARQTPGKGKSGDSIDLKDYRKDGFSLPMGAWTSAIEGVNAGMALLEEYCAKKGVEWKPKLVL